MPFAGTRSIDRLQDGRATGRPDPPAEVTILRHRCLRVAELVGRRPRAQASSISDPTVLRNVCEVMPGYPIRAKRSRRSAWVLLGSRSCPVGGVNTASHRFA